MAFDPVPARDERFTPERESNGTEGEAPQHLSEPHGGSLASRSNWLRAGVLGANDGVISTAGLVIGVAAATTDTAQIATAGVAGLVAGAVSMALGEYVSVSTQRDSERALINRERRELAEFPDAEHAELIGLLRDRGLSDESSTTVASELTERDALRAHLDVELGIDAEEPASPWAAAGSSAIAFSVGAILPLLAILEPDRHARVAEALGRHLIVSFPEKVPPGSRTPFGWPERPHGPSTSDAANARLGPPPPSRRPW